MPELRLVGVRAGLGQCPQLDGFVLRLKDVQGSAGMQILIIRRMRSEG